MTWMIFMYFEEEPLSSKRKALQQSEFFVFLNLASYDTRNRISHDLKPEIIHR